MAAAAAGTNSIIDSPLFNKVHQRIHNSKLPRQLSEDEQAEIAYAWDKLSNGQQEVAARHVKIALRSMGFSDVNKAVVQQLLQQHGLQPEAGIPWLAFQEVRGVVWWVAKGLSAFLQQLVVLNQPIAAAASFVLLACCATCVAPPSSTVKTHPNTTKRTHMQLITNPHHLATII